jgi:hypothetical protein
MATMFTDSEAYYPFTITDLNTQVLLESRGLPPECARLFGKLVTIEAAMHAVEASGAINPGLSNHDAQTTPSGPNPYDNAYQPCACTAVV